MEDVTKAQRTICNSELVRDMIKRCAQRRGGGKKDNKAVYAATEIACGWAGVVMKKA